MVADVGRGDWVLSQITSNPYGDMRAIRVSNESFERGSLGVESFVRPGKLFAPSSNLFLSEVGLLKQTSVQEILKVIAELFRVPGEYEPSQPGGRRAEGLGNVKDLSTTTKSMKRFWLSCTSDCTNEHERGKVLIGTQ